MIRWAQAGYGPIALVGQTKADVRDVMVEAGDSSILKISLPTFFPNYEPSKRRLTWPNGVMAHIYSGDEPDQLRGPQHAKAWADECAKWKYPREAWDNLEFGLRIGDNPQVIATTTPKPTPFIKGLVADPDTVTTRGSSYENMANLSKVYINRVIRRYEGTHLGRQEIHGEIMGEIEGALWTRDIIENHRHNGEVPDLFRIGIGVDPAASSHHETGIIAAGVAWVWDARQQRQLLHGYLLDDLTVEGAPAYWAKAALSGYNKWKADIIIGEVNNGGEMVENTLRTIEGGSDVNYRAVHASRNKQTRAEPIQALYEQGRIHHVGFFPDLEDQLCSWIPGEEKSPDRLDALVWIFTALIIEGESNAGDLEDLGEIDDYKPRWR